MHSDLDIQVPPKGPKDADILLVGESPGVHEAKRGIPFCGPSGREQDAILKKYKCHPKKIRMTNLVCRLLGKGEVLNIQERNLWDEYLQHEIMSCKPDLIIAVGRESTRWFLGDKATMEMCHGVAHKAGCFDSTREMRSFGAYVLPVYHPAAGLRNNDLRSYVYDDYSKISQMHWNIKFNKTVYTPTDHFLGKEYYIDISPRLVEVLDGHGKELDVVGFDTEGTPDRPWSLQISTSPGTGFVVRVDQPEFKQVIPIIQNMCDKGVLFAAHNFMYDLKMAHVMGLNLHRGRLFDSMYAAYLLSLEPQALQGLAWRHCGMWTDKFSSVVGSESRHRHLEYLVKVVEMDLPAPQPETVTLNNGLQKVTQPRSISKLAHGILRDVRSGKVTKEGPVDPFTRWHKIDKNKRSIVESNLGPMIGSELSDIPLSESIPYAARDADAALRLYKILPDILRERNLDRLMETGMGILPIASEMEINGFPASRSYFREFYGKLTKDMLRIGKLISRKYYGGSPINPGSSRDTASLLRRSGLRGKKKTKSGQMSTSQKSIEHLKYNHKVVETLFKWRQVQHVRDSFCKVALDNMSEDGNDIQRIKCNIKITRTHTRRFASSEPNLLAIPIRTKIGAKVRRGYIAPKGYKLVAGDLSQIEYRFMAHESQDPVLLRVFRKGIDIHTQTAQMLFDVENPSKSQRDAAKTVNFGIIYGIRAPALHTEIRKQGITAFSEKDCSRMIRETETGYSGMTDYKRRVGKELKREGVIADHWGMPRYLPGVWSSREHERAEAKRHAVSQKIQGGAQGMMQNSMLALHEDVSDLRDGGIDIQWLLQVHDEAVFLVEEDYAEDLLGLLIHHLENSSGIRLRVPVEASGSISDNWAGLK
jgi:uracil-DNA glycosylase family 4